MRNHNFTSWVKTRIINNTMTHPAKPFQLPVNLQETDHVMTIDEVQRKLDFLSPTVDYKLTWSVALETVH